MDNMSGPPASLEGLCCRDLLRWGFVGIPLKNWLNG
jgi:hypothetical protein